MKQILLLILILSLLLAGCAGSASQPTPTAPVAESTNMPGTPPAAGALEGTRWALASLLTGGVETPAVPGSSVTLEFGPNGQVSGNAGCNSYSGSYEQRGDTLAFLNLVSTLMACADESVNQQESAYLKALGTGGRFEQAGSGLTLFTTDGGQIKFVPGG